MTIIILEASLGDIPTVMLHSLQLPTATVSKHSSHQALFDSDVVVVQLIVEPIIYPKFGLAPPTHANHISGRATLNNRLHLEDDLPWACRATSLAALNENRLLPTNVGSLLRYRTTHEQDQKYQYQADRSRKGEDVKVG